jgi:hypothetical protein
MTITRIILLIMLVFMVLFALRLLLAGRRR